MSGRGVVPPAAAVRPAAEGPGAAAAPDLTESEPQAQPAAQKPTGAMLALEKPRTAEPDAAEPPSARPDQKKPWSIEKSSVGSGALLEPPVLTEAGIEVQGNRMETLDTTTVQGDWGDVDMADEPVFKVPNKRKKQGKGQGKKQAKKETKVEERESDSDDCISDSVLTFDSQEEQINVVYRAEDIEEAAFRLLPVRGRHSGPTGPHNNLEQCSGEDVFLDTLSNVIADCDTADILILGGDFNSTTDDLDRNHAEPHEASRKRLWEVMEAHKLSDIWRTLNKNKRQYTWAHAIDNSLSLARLDRFYGFKHQLTLFTQCFIVPYTINVTRDIVRSLKALEIEIVELQRLEATGNRGHIEALESKKAKIEQPVRHYSTGGAGPLTL
ncbi:hypothetical protein QTP86_033900 [Hemibagrus guttatus]|nr:hypothetical protein QTP86_033900 [Hemibagrus guttatus]